MDEQILPNDSVQFTNSAQTGEASTGTAQQKPNRPLLIFTAILLLFLGGVGGFFISLFIIKPTSRPNTTSNTPMPSSTPTLGWETYRNDTLGISLQYPRDFRVAAQHQGDLADLPDTLFAIKKETSFPGSHLTTQSLLQIMTIPNLRTAQSCYIKTNDSSRLAKSKVINGHTFFYSDRYGGAAAGTHDTNEEYKVFNDTNNTCFAILLRHLESSDWNNPKDRNTADTDQKQAFN